jgi:hypothetical protein
MTLTTRQAQSIGVPPGMRFYFVYVNGALVGFVRGYDRSYAANAARRTVGHMGKVTLREIPSARAVQNALNKFPDLEKPLPNKRNPGRTTRKTVEVMLPFSRDGATRFLRRHRIPFTHLREASGGGVVVRIRRGYLLDFQNHMRAHGGARVSPENPGRAKRTARGRVPNRRRNSAQSDRKPTRSFTVSGIKVEWFQGYAEYVYYLREADGKPYKHKVETDAAELYLCSHPEFGNCLLIVDPSGSTPLWK